jgi:hypothetical protein
MGQWAPSDYNTTDRSFVPEVLPVVVVLYCWYSTQTVLVRYYWWSDGVRVLEL